MVFDSSGSAGDHSFMTDGPPPASRSAARGLAPWVTLAAGLLMLLVGLPVAVVAFSRAVSPTSFGAEFFSMVSGRESQGSNVFMLILVLAAAAAISGLGVMLSLASLFVVTRRGTRVAARAVSQHKITGQARATVETGGRALMGHQRRLGAAIKARLDASDEERPQLPAPGKRSDHRDT